MARRETALVGPGRTARHEMLAPAGPRAVLTAIGEVVYDWHLADDTIVWGSSAEAVLGRGEADALATGAAFARAVEPGKASRADAVGIGGPDIGTGVPYRLRYHLGLGDGRRVVVEDAGRWFAGADGPALAHGVLRVEPAAMDERGRLIEGLRDEVAEAVRGRRPATLLILAPEGALSEAALDGIAARARSVMRRRERLVRYAGDRFALLLTACPPNQAEIAARRLAAAVEAGGSRVRVGAACTPDHALDAPTLLRLAEAALAAGRDAGVAIHAPAPCRPAPPPRRAHLLDILDALNDRRIALVCQPVVEAASRVEAFAEVRVGVRRPDGTLALGREIMPAAERAGLAPLVDARVLELAAGHLAARPTARLAIALSAATLASSDWLATLAAHLGARPGIASRLVVEVGETAMAEESSLRARLDAMKALGVAVALTGFGAGGTALAGLRGLPVDLVRIDGAFVQNLGRSPDDRRLVRGLVDLAHHLGIATVAEWVEDEATAGLLTAWGVDYLQGEHLGAPAALADAAGETVARLAQA